MDSRQTRTVNSGNSILQLMNDNPLKWNGIPSIATRVAQIDTRTDAIDNLQQMQKALTQPITANKDAIKLNMAEKGAAIANGIATYAEDNNIVELADEYAGYNFTWLFPGRDLTAFQRNDIVSQKADSLRAELLPLGFTDVIIDDYQTLVTSFNDILGKTDSKLAEKAAATYAIEVEIAGLKGDIASLKRAMGIFRITDIDFYNTFLYASKIDNTGVRHVKLRMVIKEQNTLAVLPKALATILETGDTARSGSTGKLRFFSLEAGVYTLHVELEGYEIQTVNEVVIEPEGITDRVVLLVKIPVG